MAEASTSPTHIVRRQFADTNGPRGLLHYVPNRLYRHSISPCSAYFVASAKELSSINAGRSKPHFQFASHPVRNRNRSNVASLTHQVDDGPVFLPLLKMIQRQCDGFVSSQPTREQESQQSAVSFSFQPLAIRRLPKRLPLLCSQPVAKANA